MFSSAAHNRVAKSNVTIVTWIARTPSFFKVASHVDAAGHIPAHLAEVLQKSCIFP